MGKEPPIPIATIRQSSPSTRATAWWARARSSMAEAAPVRTRGECLSAWATAELRIVPSQDLGQLGPRDGPPVVFHWRWWYHVPSLPLWAILLLLLVVPKANRHRQAWLILIPLGLVLLVWRMPATLFSLPDGATETMGFFVVSLVMAWTMVWLSGIGWGLVIAPPGSF